MPLEPQVYDLLSYLVRHHERVVTKDELIDHLWPERYVSEGVLNTRVMAARRAIGDTGRDQRLIRTLHRRGFRFIAPVEADAPGETWTAASASDVLPAPALAQQIRFCTTASGVRLAHALSGQGPLLVKAANWLSHLEFDWRSPVWRHWLQALTINHTLLRYDQRGCGLSDWTADDLGFDAWLEDLETVVESTDAARFPLFGMSQGAAVAIAYAVRHPDRVSHLVLYGSYSQGWRARGRTRREIKEREALLTLTGEGWGRDDPAYRQIFASQFIPGADLEHMRWFNDLCRVSTSPENAVRLLREFAAVDVDHLLPLVKVPTLVLHARHESRAPFEEGLKIAARIPGAQFVPLESANHILLEDEPAWPVFLAEMRRFLL